ncbi:MAG: helix-turn-helix domain-containing protein [Sedimentisphaerales bacterium]|nr:helix-turn-helix domain-containing protein [Sedimentisphaerales bacterium]
MDNPLLIDVNSVCKLLGISRATYFVQKAAGRIGPSEIRFGKKLLLRRAEVEAWVNCGCPPRRQWEWKANTRNT